MELDPEEIDSIIRDADLDQICYPQTGDCVSVAVAIRNVFGGEYICGYETYDDTTPVHATVDIDGVLYDGNGKTSIEELYDVAISGLKADEIGDFGDHIGSVSNLTKNSLYDDDTRNRVEEKLTETLEEYKAD